MQRQHYSANSFRVSLLSVRYMNVFYFYLFLIFIINFLNFFKWVRKFLFFIFCDCEHDLLLFLCVVDPVGKLCDKYSNAVDSIETSKIFRSIVVHHSIPLVTQQQQQPIFFFFFITHTKKILF